MGRRRGPRRHGPRSAVRGSDRAHPSDRGRAADQPSDIPARGWRDILWRVWARIAKDNVSIIAAGVAFYAMLAIFPAITAFLSVFGLFADAGQVQTHLASFKDVMPADAWTLINDQVTAVVSARSRSLGFAVAVSLLVALWSAGAGVRALMTALNIAYHEDEKRGVVAFYLTALLFTIGTGVMGLLSLGVIVAVPVILTFLPLGPLAGMVLKLLPWLVLAGFVTIALGMFYRYGASREQARTRWVSWGAVLAALLWICVSVLFSLYVSNFGSYNQTYGTLGAVVVLLMWLWISAFIVLLGAELNAEMEHQTEHDTTTGAPQPMGRRGAFVADHLGEVP